MSGVYCEFSSSRGEGEGGREEGVSGVYCEFSWRGDEERESGSSGVHC